MATLSKDRILAATELPEERVAVLGGEVIVRGMSGFQRDRFEQALIASRKGKGKHAVIENLRARLVAASVVNEDGSRMFTDAEVEQLGQVNALTLTKLFSAAQRVNGLSDEDVDELGNAGSDETSGAGSSSH